MFHDDFSRRKFTAGMGLLAGGVSMAIVSKAEAGTTAANPAAEISLSHPAIHQEIVFAADPARLYQTLTAADRFDRVVQLSGVMSSMMKSIPHPVPTHIDARPGGDFALFGGYITGYNLELVPNARIVQAWRAGSWTPGGFSIATFALSKSGANTRLTFDQTGFPDDAAEHLAKGWHANYWKPMATLLREG
jgi:activator of HSP90 ATPase